MRVFRSTQEFEVWRQGAKQLGFVPTMGNLHAGHMALLAEALSNHTHAVLSIFVNPTQFGPNEDFKRYPRTLENDLALAQDLEGRHPGKEVIVWAPADPKEIYPAGFASTIHVTGLSDVLEGKLRPGHFDGVATVVYLLLNVVKPTRAYFGMKDYQQCRVVERMVTDLRVPVEVVVHPIVRDENGLALSSRNQYLSEIEKRDALHLSATLRKLCGDLAGKLARVPAVVEQAEKICAQDPRWQYLTLRDGQTLEPVSRPGRAVWLGVLKVGTVRLLDNLEVELA